MIRTDEKDVEALPSVSEDRDGARDPLLVESDESERNAVSDDRCGLQIGPNVALFGAYFMSHFSSKCSSTVKTQLQSEAGFSILMLSCTDAVFILFFSATWIRDLNIPSVDRVYGLAWSGFCLFLILVALWFDFRGWSALPGNMFLLLVYAIFGFCRAAGGPSVMDNWAFASERSGNRSLAVYSWSCHQFCGDIFAGVCTAYILGIGLPYWWALLTPALCSILWSRISTKLIASPTYVEAVTQEELADKDVRNEKEEAKETVRGDTPLSLFDTCTIRFIMQYAFLFGFIKITGYVLYFWLPYFWGKTFDPVTANLLATAYSFGLLPSGCLVGYIPKRYHITVIGVSTSIVAMLLGVFALFGDELPAAPLIFILVCLGILVGGVNNMIASAVTSDLVSSHPLISTNDEGLENMTILVNGCSSIVASIGLLTIGPLQDDYGWGAVWWLLVACAAACTVLLVLPKLVRKVFPPSIASDYSIGIQI